MPEFIEDSIEVRSKREQGWFWLDNSMIDIVAREIGHDALAVYVVLCRFSDTTTQKCHPSLSRIQENLKIGRSKIMEALQCLESNGIISIESSRGMGGSNIYTLLDTKSRQSHSETTIGSPTVRRGQSRSETGVVSLRDAKEDSVKEDSVKEDRKKKGTNSVGALQMNRKDRKLIHPEKDLIAWMKDTARDYGRKGWKLSGHYSNTNKNYQGPTPSMEEKLYEREKQKNGAEIVRTSWLRFLENPETDRIRYPFAEFLNVVLVNIFEKIEEERLESTKKERLGWLDKVAEGNNLGWGDFEKKADDAS